MLAEEDRFSSTSEARLESEASSKQTPGIIENEEDDVEICGKMRTEERRRESFA